MAQLDARSSGKIGIRALTYYMVTTVLAAIIGIFVVLTIHPGNPRIKNIVSDLENNDSNVSTLDAILDIIRYFNKIKFINKILSVYNNFYKND
jgi:solute carrier family 1 (high affinity glutamate transporter) protein 2